MEYGWYYDEGSVQGESDDLWTLVEEAVVEAARTDRVGRLRVGPMRSARITDYLDTEDITIMREEARIAPRDLCCLVSDGHWQAVFGGTATCDDLTADLSQMSPAEVLAWAHDHITLDPITYCDGEWLMGVEDCTPYIGYHATQHRWYWDACEADGFVDTLREAMAACEAAIATYMDGTRRGT